MWKEINYINILQMIKYVQNKIRASIDLFMFKKIYAAISLHYKKNKIKEQRINIR